MEKIILTEKTIGNIINRLKKFMENHVFKSQLLYDIKPSKARHPALCKKERLGKDYSIGRYYMNAKVTRHWFSKMERDRNPTPLIHVHFHKDAGDYYSEGDVFYFYGSMILVDKKDCLLIKNGKTRVIDKMQLVSSPDANLISNIKTRNAEEEAYADEYWKGIEGMG